MLTNAYKSKLPVADISKLGDVVLTSTITPAEFTNTKKAAPTVPLYVAVTDRGTPAKQTESSGTVSEPTGKAPPPTVITCDFEDTLPQSSTTVHVLKITEPQPLDVVLSLKATVPKALQLSVAVTIGTGSVPDGIAISAGTPTNVGATSSTIFMYI